MLRLLLATCLLLASAQLSAEDQPKDKAELPKILMAVPFSAAAGATIKVKLRGWKLDQASEVKLFLPGAMPKILIKGGAPLPNGQDAKNVGEHQIEFEVAIPAGAPASEAQVTVLTPAGESEPYTFIITGDQPDVDESEPNDGFNKAKVLELPQTVAGQIQSDRDVDVFAFSAEKGKLIRANVLARAHGSAVDGFLTLFDSQGNIIAINDDAATADAELKVTVPATGMYRLVLQDAHDRGGPAHPYRLRVSLD